MTAAKRYRIIFNSDGGDLHSHEAATPEGFLSVRAKALEGTHVDAICYSTHGSFNHCTHDTKVGETGGPTRVPPNHAQTLIKTGRDCLQIIIDWAHKNDIHAFWSMRMNDCHDGKQLPALADTRSKFVTVQALWA